MGTQRKLNTTSGFDALSATAPVESERVIRLYACVRLLCVFGGLVVAWLSLRGDLTGLASVVSLVASFWIGFGRYGDGLEPVWRRIKPLARLGIYLVALFVFLLSFWFGHTTLTHTLGLALGILLLATLAAGLIEILITPARAVRHRQIKRHLATLPRRDRPRVADRLEREFQTINAEGFYAT